MASNDRWLWMMHLNEYRRKRSHRMLRWHPRIFLEGLSKTMETSVRIANLRANIRTRTSRRSATHHTANLPTPVLIRGTEYVKWSLDGYHLLDVSVAVDGGFPISFIDNAHSRLAGLTGVYGNLVVRPQRLTLHDPSSDQVLCTWKWQQLHQFHLAATEIKDDENKICIIHTSR
jgi:hypothetical protein